MVETATIQLSNDEIANIVTRYGVRLDASQLECVRRYVAKLLRWNQTISLTALEDPVEIVARHFGESMFVTSILPLNSGRLADVGTGAGFPGMALKILCPELEVVLLEPNHKKCAFLAEIQSELSLSGVQIVRHRFEEVGSAEGAFDFICSRALGNYKKMLQWAAKAVRPAGSVLLWLGADDSVAVGRVNGWTWDVPVRIPDSERRVILRGRIVRS